jgi:hypothetical protein
MENKLSELKRTYPKIYKKNYDKIKYKTLNFNYRIEHINIDTCINFISTISDDYTKQPLITNYCSYECVEEFIVDYDITVNQENSHSMTFIFNHNKNPKKYKDVKLISYNPPTIVVYLCV